jgi:TonB family protein
MGHRFPILFAIAATLWGQAQPARRVAVHNFEDIGSSAPQQIGRKLSDRLLGKLADSGVYQMIDRQFLEVTLKEQDMPAGRFDASTAIKIGKLVNVAAIVDGTITTFTINRRSSEDALGIYGTVTLAATARLISTETGAILKAPVASQAAKGMLQPKPPQAQTNCRVYPIVGRVCNPQQAPQSTAETKTVEQLLDEAMEACARSLSTDLISASPAVTVSSMASANQPSRPATNSAAVIGVSEGLTYINRGSSTGLRIGQIFQVYRVVAVPGLTDPETGRPLTRKKPVCTLTLSEVDDRTSNGPCKGDPPAAQDAVEPQSAGGAAVAQPSQRTPLAAANRGNDVEGPCAALADRALDQMQNPPAGWASSLSPILRQIESQGLNAYIRANGGAFALLASTRRDLAQQRGDTYGINLNQAWIDLLVCMPHEPIRYQAPPEPVKAVPPDLVAACDASAELSDRCAEAYITRGLDLRIAPRAEPFFRKSLHIREQGPHTDQSLAIALELEAKALRDSHQSGAQDLLDRAFVLRQKSVYEMNRPDSGSPYGQPTYAAGDAGVSPAMLLFKVEPAFTETAQSAHIDPCNALLSIFVETNGQVGSVTLVKSCGLGLDEEAARAVLHQWKFRPAMKAGIPGRMAAQIEVSFSLH